MKNNTLIIFYLLFALGCKEPNRCSQGQFGNHKNDGVANDTVEMPQVDLRDDESNNQKWDGLNIAIEDSSSVYMILSRLGVINNSYATDNILSVDFHSMNDDSIAIIKIVGTSEGLQIGDELGDPIVNLFIKTSSNEMRILFYLGSADLEDVNIVVNGRGENGLIVEYYSSPVGFFKYYLIPSEGDKVFFINQLFDYSLNIDSILVSANSNQEQLTIYSEALKEITYPLVEMSDR